jgi:hypothetical protein
MVHEYQKSPEKHQELSQERVPMCLAEALVAISLPLWPLRVERFYKVPEIITMIRGKPAPNQIHGIGLEGGAAAKSNDNPIWECRQSGWLGLYFCAKVSFFILKLHAANCRESSS